MSDVISSLQLLFDRPNESLITPKGEKKAVFQLTEQFLVSDSQIISYYSINVFHIRLEWKGIPSLDHPTV